MSYRSDPNLSADFMNEHKLLVAVGDFERIIKSSERYHSNSNQLSLVISVFFSMKSAFLIRACLELHDGDLPKSAMDGMDYIEQESLPRLDTVREAKPKLVAAVASNNKAAIVNALEELGVFALCPTPNKQLPRMERLSQKVNGPARLVFLVELALFAVELGDFDVVTRYATEAWGYAPSGWELYNLFILEGLSTLKAGRTEEAVRYLKISVHACLTDEHTLISCGLRSPNFLLAQKLFERGAHDVVLKYLVDCKKVWQRSWMPIDEWIKLIESGQTPDFNSSENLKSMSLPSARFGLQWMRARSLAEAKEPSSSASTLPPTEEVVAAKERLLADVDRYISDKVKDTIRYLDNNESEPHGQ